jgi:hypothetical protein
MTTDPRNFRHALLLRAVVLAVTVGGIGSFLETCSLPAVTADGGSGTGVGNGMVTGRVIYPDSTPVVGAVVRLRANAYLADTSGSIPVARSATLCQTVTDSLGNFNMDSLDTGGGYSIEVVDYQTQVRGTLYRTSFPSGNTNKLETRVVTPVTKIKGSVVISGLPQNAYVQVYGMERLSRTDADGNFVIQDLPLGRCENLECEYKLRIFSPVAGGGVKSVDMELEVNADPNGNIISVELDTGN